MDPEAEKVAEEIAPVIAGAIESANESREHAEDVAEVLADAAMESERGRRIEEVEKDLGECLSNQADLSEAVAALALQTSEMQGQLSTLQALMQPPPPPPSESAPEDGQKESPEAEATVVIAPEAEQVAMPEAEPEKPARKKKRWI